jgi:toxin-antitoxin system PIN domain toxin
MVILDINVLVYAAHRESPDHDHFKAWVEQLLASDRVFGVPEVVLCNVIRVLTLPRPWKRRMSTAEALAFCDALRSSPRCLVLQPSERHWALFEDLCLHGGVQANLVNDAYLAAFALDRDAEWVTADGDFGKFPGLKWRRLPADQVRTNPR